MAGDKTGQAASPQPPQPLGATRLDLVDAVHKGDTTMMMQQMQTPSAQRTVIGWTPTGQPRTYRLMRVRSRSARVVIALRRFLP